MREITELYDLFQELVSTCTDIPKERIILADQGRSPPAGNQLYATYNPLPIRAYGQPGHRYEFIKPLEDFDYSLGPDWQDLEEVTASSMEFMLSVNFFNEGASQAAMMLQNANFRTHVSDFLFIQKIGFRYVSSLRNLNAYFQAGIQPRWQADVHLFIEHEVASKVLKAAGFHIKYIREE